MIRQAGPDDLEHIVDLGRRFHAASLWSDLVPFEADDFRQSAGALIERESAVIFLSEDGFIGVSKVPLYFNFATPITAELFFWAPDGKGNDLLKAAREWAGGLLVMNAHRGDERVCRWYRMQGFQQVEASYLRAG